MKKILVPVDFSPCSESAVNYAVGIAENTNTEIHFVHIVELDYAFTGGNAEGAKLDQVDQEGTPMAQIKEVFKNAETLLDDCVAGLGGGIRMEKQLLEGDLVGELLTYSNEKEIDMIVMGSHGDRGVNTMLMGSNAQKMIRMSKVPVIVVNENTLSGNFKKITYTSDFKEDSMNDSLDYVKRIVDFYDSSLHLLFVNSPNKFEDSDIVDSRIEKIIEKYDLEGATYSTFNCSWIEEGIVKYSKLSQPDLLVINTHGYHGLKKMFHHSIAESVVNNAEVPVMVLSSH